MVAAGTAAVGFCVLLLDAPHAANNKMMVVAKAYRIGSIGIQRTKTSLLNHGE
jgi:hypothetical protein